MQNGGSNKAGFLNLQILHMSMKKKLPVLYNGCDKVFYCLVYVNFTATYTPNLIIFDFNIVNNTEEAYKII